MLKPIATIKTIWKIGFYKRLSSYEKKWVKII
jgi:hypothetical protein